MSNQEQWTSKLDFILAAAGSAIGLGAIWKFPYMTGTIDGGIFPLFFIVFTLIIGAPILIAEFAIGRHAHVHLLFHWLPNEKNQGSKRVRNWCKYRSFAF